VKDDLNIEALFKEKFSSFEGEVSPDAWANIQQGMNVAGAAGSSAGATGLSLLAKTIIISGGIVAATVATVVLLSGDDSVGETPAQNLVVNNEDNQNNNNEFVVDGESDAHEVQATVDGRNELANEGTNDIDENSVEDNAAANEVDNTGSTNPYSGSVDGGGNSDGEMTEEDQSAGAADGNNADTDGTREDKDKPTITSGGGGTSGAGETPGPIAVKALEVNLEVIPGDQFAPSTYTFISNAQNARKVEWVLEDGTILDGEEVEYTFEKPGRYEVTMNAYGDNSGDAGSMESKTTTIEIESISKIEILPNVITRNGDGINDFFTLKTVEIAEFYIVITDANGVRIWESEDPNFEWHGTNMGGEVMPNGLYYYNFFAKGTDGEKHAKANHITLQ